MVFVSLGAPRRERKGEGVQLPASCLPPPQKEHIPMLLLLQEPHLTTLFDLLEMLACFKAPIPNTETSQESPEVSLHSQSHRRKWELALKNLWLVCRVSGVRSFTSTQRISLVGSGSSWCSFLRVPRCFRPSRTSRMKRSVRPFSKSVPPPRRWITINGIEWFQNGEGLCWKELLRIKSPHKLLYALEIIEALGKPNRRIHRESTVRSAAFSFVCSSSDRGV